MPTTFVVPALVLASALFCACGEEVSGPPAFYPADYAETYQEVRNCRFSLEHSFVRIRVLASPDALTPYTTRAQPFPTGAVLLKEEFDEDDEACARTLRKITVMRKLEPGSAPDMLDWEWQTTEADGAVVDVLTRPCYSCHKDCGVLPMGYEGTCTVP